jgi:hypothetical protein
MIVRKKFGATPSTPTTPAGFVWVPLTTTNASGDPELVWDADRDDARSPDLTTMPVSRFADHLQVGDHASRPVATAVAVGTLYSCTDHGLIYQSDGATWSTYATMAGGGAPAAHTHPSSEISDATAAGIAILTAANAAAQRTALALVIGTNVQAYDADLGVIAALTRTRGDLIVGGASDWTDLALGAANNVLCSDGTDVVWSTPLESLIIAVGDETTAITTGDGKVTFRMPYAFTLVGLPRASLTTQSSSGAVTIDIEESGSTIFSTLLTIDASEKTSTTAATPCVVSDTSLADDAEMKINIDGAGTGAAGLKVTLIGRRT